jgi:septation ring formation regulator EzrA
VEPANSGVPGDSKASALESTKTVSSDSQRCAILQATYEGERNALLGGDRTTLREQLTQVGNRYRDKMKEIPGCSFPAL